jgi:hypothetical protein
MRSAACGQCDGDERREDEQRKRRSEDGERCGAGMVELGAQRVAGDDGAKESCSGADEDPARFLTEE